MRVGEDGRDVAGRRSGLAGARSVAPFAGDARRGDRRVLRRRLGEGACCLVHGVAHARERPRSAQSNRRGRRCGSGWTAGDAHEPGGAVRHRAPPPTRQLAPGRLAPRAAERSPTDAALTAELDRFAGETIDGVSRGLLDTSIFIGREQRRALGELPRRGSNLRRDHRRAQLGAAAADDRRPQRADTLALARAADPIPISEAIISAFARPTIAAEPACARRSSTR